MKHSILFLIALSACGKVSGLVDGGGSGTNFDANTTDGPADAQQGVSVTVRDPNTGALLVGTQVVFNDSTGAPVAHVPTDQNGVAFYPFTTGGSVTAVFTETATFFEMSTVLGVKLGDSITINSPVTNDTSTSTFTVHLSSEPSAASYTVYGPCGSINSATTTVALTIDGDCKQSSMDLVAVSYDVNNNILGYLEQAGIAYTPNGSASITGSWQPFQAFTPTATNLSADITSVNFSRYWPKTSYGYSAGSGGTINGTIASATTAMTGPSAATGVSEVTLRAGQGTQIIRQTNAGNATSYTLDTAANKLLFVAHPTLTLATKTVSVATSGTSTVTPDLVERGVRYGHVVGTATYTISWTVYGPDTTDVVLPTLPPEVGDFNPATGDTLTSALNNFCEIVEYDNVNGYDDARQHPVETIDEFFDDDGTEAKTARESRSPLQG